MIPIYWNGGYRPEPEIAFDLRIFESSRLPYESSVIFLQSFFANSLSVRAQFTNSSSVLSNHL